MVKSKKRRRKLKVRSKKFGVFAGVWAIVAALFTICWLTLGGVLWFVGALLMGLASVMSAIATFDPDSAVPAPKPRRSGTASPRGNSGSRSRGSSPGTAPRKKAPVRPRKKVCSARCRASTLPVSSCRCICGGKGHGSQKLKAVS